MGEAHRKRRTQCSSMFQPMNGLRRNEVAMKNHCRYPKKSLFLPRKLLQPQRKRCEIITAKPVGNSLRNVACRGGG